jgi:hypothetical protein
MNFIGFVCDARIAWLRFFPDLGFSVYFEIFVSIYVGRGGVKVGGSRDVTLRRRAPPCSSRRPIKVRAAYLHTSQSVVDHWTGFSVTSRRNAAIDSS